MKIGFDIDDTLNDLRYTGTRIFNEHLQRRITKEVIDSSTSVHIYEAFGLGKEEGFRIWRTLQNRIHDESLPLEGAVQALKKLEQAGHDIFYITARENTSEVREGTITWLQRYGFPFRERHLFMGMEDTEKAVVAQNIGLQLFFDDKPQVLEAFRRTNIQVFLKDTCYNKHVNFNRISNWLELDDLDF